MNDKTIIKLVAIICLTILEAVNMAIFGVNGVIVALIIAGICGLAGYELGVTEPKGILTKVKDYIKGSDEYG